MLSRFLYGKWLSLAVHGFYMPFDVSIRFKWYSLGDIEILEKVGDVMSRFDCVSRSITIITIIITIIINIPTQEAAPASPTGGLVKIEVIPKRKFTESQDVFQTLGFR